MVAACDGGRSEALDARPIVEVDQDCYGTGLVNVCVDKSEPHGPVVLAGTFDTTTSSRCLPGHAACVIRGNRITTGTLRVIGDLPLILLAEEWIHVQGDFDASSKRTGERGPGANPASCGVPDDAFAQGGGAGGSYGGRGGDGGAGVADSAQAAPLAAVVEPLGGCAGARGAGNSFTAPGAGGGAVFLIARQEIVIETSLNASGAGGAGAATTGGGAGGGSGGFIGLDAPSVRIAGSVFANGGGGGEGGPAGAAGADPDVVGAAGGSGGTGGDGGAGGARASTAGARGEASADGGGGGGGGAGVVMIIPPQATGGVVSP